MVNKNEQMDRLKTIIATATAMLNELRYTEDDSVKAEHDDVLALYERTIEYGDGYLWCVNHRNECVYCFDAETNMSGYNCYPLENYAMKAAKMKKYIDMMLAFKYCYDVDYEPDWSNANEVKCYVRFDTKRNQYDVFCSVQRPLHVVYFSNSDIAERCAEWLNKIDPKGELFV